MAKMLTRPAMLIPLHLLAFWPVWQWYGRRMLDTSDEPYGVIALVTAALFLFFRGRLSLSIAPRQLWIPTLLTLIYALTYHISPMIVRAALAMTAITATICSCTRDQKFHLGLWLLLLLALPVIASLQFFVGYPFRVVVGKIAALLLNLNGRPVVLDGTLLCWADHLVSIDAPCSGIKMLWTGGYMAATLSCFLGLSHRHTLFFSSLTVLTVLGGNVIRTTALFYAETSLFHIPVWGHEMIGIFCFGLTAMGIALMALKFKSHGGKPCAF